MNLQDRDVELNWREVTCKRSVDGDSFSRGIQDFDFSVSGKNAFIPSLSYFLIDAELLMVPKKFPRMADGLPVSKTSQAADIELATPSGFRRPMVSDGIALADHFGSTLYNNAFFRAGNSDVSLITQYIPQAGVLKSRLDKSNAWSRNVGRIVFQDDADFERRRQYISFDGTFHDDGLKPLQYTEIFQAIQPQGTGAASMAFNNAGAPLGDAAASYPLAKFDTGVVPSFNIPSAVTNIAFVQANAGANPPVLASAAIGAGAAVNTVAIGALGAVPALAPSGIFTVLEQADAGVINFDVSALPNNTIVVFGDAAANTAQYVKLLYRIATADPGGESQTWAAEVVGGNDASIPQARLTKILIPHDPACGSSITQVMFQPPIGIFSEANAISGGDFKISLNPSPSFATNGIQSIMPLTAGTAALPSKYDYKLNIRNVKFYVATIKSDVSPTGVIPLTLIEMAVLNKTLNQSGGLQNLDFTVPPSTLAITVFVQGGDAGTQTVIPATKFYLQGDGAANGKSTDLNPVTGLPVGLYNNIANNVQNIQVTYGSITKTQTLYSSGYNSNSGINNNVQRFLQSIQYSGKITSEGGSESHPQYLERGNYWHFDFSKDKNDTSSYVNVQISFLDANIGQSQNLFIVAHYSRQCEISYENGFITQVVSVNR